MIKSNAFASLLEPCSQYPKTESVTEPNLSKPDLTEIFGFRFGYNFSKMKIEPDRIEFKFVFRFGLIQFEFGSVRDFTQKNFFNQINQTTR